MTGRGHCNAREFRGDRCVDCLENSDFHTDGPGDHRGDCCKTRDFCGDRRFYLKNYKQLLIL